MQESINEINEKIEKMKKGLAFKRNIAQVYHQCGANYCKSQGDGTPNNE